MMKNKLYYILISLCCFSCSTQVIKNEKEAENKFNKKAYLKQYALCECIYKGLKSDSLTKKDNSTWGALDICDCSPELFKKIDSLSLIVVNSILPLQASDDLSKRPIIIGCSDFSNSYKLDSLINSYHIATPK